MIPSGRLEISEAHMGRIVVGVDDSAGARAALAWALREAELRDAQLEVAHSWSLPMAEGWNSEWPTDEAWFRERSRQFLEKVIAEFATGDSTAIKPIAVPIESEVPALGLVERSEGADLLVVGSRGRGGFKGLLLGSVSAQCVQHATCPVVVVKRSKV
jgi:nucleotide-binding universal stress UspA family protein